MPSFAVIQGAKEALDLGITGPEGIEISRPEEVRKAPVCPLSAPGIHGIFRVEETPIRDVGCAASLSPWGKVPRGSFLGSSFLQAEADLASFESGCKCPRETMRASQG